MRRISLSAEKGHALLNARGRLAFLKIFFLAAFAIVAIRSFDLSVIQGELRNDEDLKKDVAALSRTQNDMIRADIVDRNGVLLARTIEMPSLFVDPT